MIPSVNVPAPQATPVAPSPITPAAVAPVPSQAAANLVYQSVPANSSPVALFNNVRGSSAEALQSRSGEVLEQAFRQQQGGHTRGTAAPRFGFSSAFLAQAMSQEEVANDNESIYRRYEATEEPVAADTSRSTETVNVPRYLETQAQHLSSLQRVSIKAYQKSVSRSALSLNQQTLLSIARTA